MYWIKNIKSFIFLLSAKEKYLFFYALFYLYFYKIYLLLIPFKKWSKYARFSKEFEKEITTKELKKITLSFIRAGKFYIGKNSCLIISLALKKYLNSLQVKSTLHLGLINKEYFIAHAWLTYKKIELTKKKENYHEILTIE
ncbi:MAG: lasso peptide biosynthesis B2 protein [Flavobacteriia bacterium]|nr:lasso peptide biosynthesis B2 protein [Flavobacteriia bacterium]